jgi:hypothetical protein
MLRVFINVPEIICISTKGGSRPPGAISRRPEVGGHPAIRIMNYLKINFSVSS